MGAYIVKCAVRSRQFFKSSQVYEMRFLRNATSKRQLAPGLRSSWKKYAGKRVTYVWFLLYWQSIIVVIEADGPKGICGLACLIDWQSGSLLCWNLDEHHPIELRQCNLGIIHGRDQKVARFVSEEDSC